MILLLLITLHNTNMHDILVLYYDYIDSAVEHYEILQKYYRRHLIKSTKFVLPCIEPRAMAFGS